jgi:hypothetical protein
LQPVERQNAAGNITHVRLHKRCYIRTTCGQTQHRYEKYVSSRSMPAGSFTKKQCRRAREQTDDPSANMKKTIWAKIASSALLSLRNSKLES